MNGGNSGGFGAQNNFLVGQQNGISATNAIGFNFSDVWAKKLTVSGSYFFNNSNNTNEQLTNRVTTLKDSNFYYKENDLAKSKNYNNRLNLRLEYKIDSFNSILITPSLSFQKNNSASQFSGINSYDGITPTSSADNTISTATSGYNINNNVLFRHSFAKRGRTISLGINTTLNKKNGDLYLVGNNKLYDSIGTAIQNSIQQQLTDNLANSHTISLNLAYTEPFGKKGQLQVNYNPSFTRSRADQETFLYDQAGQKYSLFDTSLSNKFNNNYNTQNGGIAYRVGDRDKQFSIGANYHTQNFSVISNFRKYQR
ncbi:MAG: hypothetical protein E6H06_03530 [Bacteroidetes bacterium]|nr:MAG: hypothetical protein E6H06_03530 [Bacteroidota bacterium]